MSKTGFMTPNASGNVTKIFARMIAYGREHDMNAGRIEQTGPMFRTAPTKARERNPATAVGIAVGREIVTIIALRPQKLYFERT